MTDLPISDLDLLPSWDFGIGGREISSFRKLGFGFGIWDLVIEGREGEIFISEIGVRVRYLGFGNRRE